MARRQNAFWPARCQAWPVCETGCGLCSAAPLCYLASFMVLHRYADATLPTAHGVLRTVVYRDGQSVAASSASPVIVPAQDEHLAIVAGEVRGGEGVLCRVHSECWTGETLGSLKCDCRA